MSSCEVTPKRKGRTPFAFYILHTILWKEKTEPLSEAAALVARDEKHLVDYVRIVDVFLFLHTI